jgi:hypothetical protein
LHLSDLAVFSAAPLKTDVRYALVQDTRYEFI